MSKVIDFEWTVHYTLTLDKEKAFEFFDRVYIDYKRLLLYCDRTSVYEDIAYSYIVDCATANADGLDEDIENSLPKNIYDQSMSTAMKWCAEWWDKKYGATPRGE